MLCFCSTQLSNFASCTQSLSVETAVCALFVGDIAFVGLQSNCHWSTGASPRHATLFATDVPPSHAVRIVDRFLMYYIRTADKLTRTARWVEQMEGGIEVRFKCQRPSSSHFELYPRDLRRYYSKTNWGSARISSERWMSSWAPSATSGQLLQTIQRGRSSSANLSTLCVLHERSVPCLCALMMLICVPL